MTKLLTETPRLTQSASRAIKRGQQGFTLVELAIVLAVIGLIIGAVAIGKDVQRNAEYTKIKNKFIDQWEQTYNQYYQRTGVVLGDSQTAPRIMVNGTAYAAAVGTPTSGGDMSSVNMPARICNSAEGAGMLATDRTAATATAPALDFQMRAELARLGIRMAPGRAEGFEDRYVYLDTNGNPQEIQVCFQWNRPGMAEGSGNMMVISGLTPDLARMLDQMIDGKPDAQEGRFRQQGVANGTANAPGVQWAANNTQLLATATVGSSTDTTSNRDEDQVLTVVAVYKMNQ